MHIGRNAGIVAALALAVGAAASSAIPAESATAPAAVKAATCGAGSQPETGVQGQVPLSDRTSGRSAQGYSCNLSLIGQYQGQGASWVNPSYGHCVYMSAAFPSTLRSGKPGVTVVDVSDPKHPVATAVLNSPAMITGTWESLKVNEKRGLLAGVSGGPGVGAGFFDVYDIKTDCAHPRLLNGALSTNLTLPVNTLGHEGGWSPDGNTYWATGLVGTITAIDVADPTKPRTEFVGVTGLTNHGFSLRADGNRIYVADSVPSGFSIYDSSEIQARKPNPQMKLISKTSWSGGLFTQASIPVTYSGKSYLISFDEFGSTGIRILSLADEKKPETVTQLQLAINLPKNIKLRSQDTAANGFFGYESHYCTVDRDVNPTALACGFFQSGVRVFDIKDLSAIKEIAYYNPPAQTGKGAKLPNSEHASGVVALAPVVSDLQNLGLGARLHLGPADLSADYCSSPPRFVGSDQLWVTCQDNGFMALQFRNGVRGKS